METQAALVPSSRRSGSPIDPTLVDSALRSIVIRLASRYSGSCIRIQHRGSYTYISCVPNHVSRVCIVRYILDPIEPDSVCWVTGPRPAPPRFWLYSFLVDTRREEWGYGCVYVCVWGGGRVWLMGTILSLTLVAARFCVLGTSLRLYDVKLSQASPVCPKRLKSHMRDLPSLKPTSIVPPS